MCPILFKIGPLNIYSYGLMVALGVIAATYLVRLEAEKKGFFPDQVTGLAFYSVISGLVGARLFYVLSNIREYLLQPWEILMIHHGGLAWYGGLLFGVLGGFLYIKRNKLPVMQMIDLVIPYVALAQSIGRVGCLLNGCCFGHPAQFGLYFPLHKAVLHPTQAYSSLCDLGIFFILRIRQRRLSMVTGQGVGQIPGGIFLLYLILYSAKRFFMEFLRADSSIFMGGLTLFQIISLIVLLGSLIVYSLRWQSKRNIYLK